MASDISKRYRVPPPSKTELQWDGTPISTLSKAQLADILIEIFMSANARAKLKLSVHK